VRAVALFVIGIALPLPGYAQGQAPVPTQTTTTRLIPVSGTLVDAAGAPLTGEVAVTFSLYDEQSGGAVLWTETQVLRLDERGRYSAYLGSDTALPQSAFRDEQARWLETAAAGHAAPRAMLVAVPYALRATDAETLGGTPLSSFVLKEERAGSSTRAAAETSTPTVDGTGVPGQLAKFAGGTTISSSTITETGTNRVGIGTIDPTESGLLDSRVTIRGSDGGTALAVSNQVGTPRFALNINGDGSWVTYDRASGSFQPGIAQHSGRVGIATTDPGGGGVVESKFTVRNLDNNTGIAVLNQANARRFALNTLATGGWTIFDGGGGTWNQGLTQTGGNVAIGTTPTIDKLVVGRTDSGIVTDAPAAGSFFVNNTNSVSPAVRAQVNTIFSNWGAAAVWATSSGTGGFAGLFHASNASGNGPALIAIADGNGNGVTANATNAGDGVETTADGTGSAIYAWTPNFSNGIAGRFAAYNEDNTQPTVSVTNYGTGFGLLVNHLGASGSIAVFRNSGANVARIDKTGRGFFNNGTQASGADVAEAFEVVGALETYEPGDVLEISPDHTRRLRKSTGAYSTRVIGVYATKPGVLLSNLSIDDDHSTRVPAGVVGVIPTKVTMENGAIAPGDLLVAAATPGHAMKAGPDAPIGSIIGKALTPFTGTAPGVIDVFVNIR